MLPADRSLGAVTPTGPPAVVGLRLTLDGVSYELATLTGPDWEHRAGLAEQLAPLAVQLCARSKELAMLLQAKLAEGQELAIARARVAETRRMIDGRLAELVKLQARGEG